MAKSIRESLRRDFLFWTVLCLSILITYYYFFSIDFRYYQGRVALHSQIVNLIADPPYRYRILIPFTAQLVIKLLKPIFTYRDSFLISYCLLDFASIFVLFHYLKKYLLLWFSKKDVLIGLLIVAAFSVVPMRDHYFQPWSYIEAGLFCAGLYYGYFRQYWKVAMVIAIAALNRETSFFVILALFFAVLNFQALRRPFKIRQLLSKEEFKWLAIFSLIWLVETIALRKIIGPAVYINTLAWFWSRNTKPQFLLKTFINVFMFFGVYWYFIFKGYKASPKYIKRTALIVPWYMVPYILATQWWETRPLMMLYPIFIPLLLTAIKQADIESKKLETLETIA